MLCFCTGSLLHENKLGINRSILISSAMIVFGNLMLALSALKGTFAVALIGRVIAGVGLEC